jgi:hypothetical protein
MPLGQQLSLIRSIARRLGTAAGDRRYSRRMDLNSDGVIDNRDVKIAMQAPICARTAKF